MDTHNRGMGKGGQSSGFLEEPFPRPLPVLLHPGAVGDDRDPFDASSNRIGQEFLYRHSFVELEIDGEVCDPEAALAEHRLNTKVLNLKANRKG